MDPVIVAHTYGLAGVLRGQNNVIRRDQAIAAGVSPQKLAGLLRRGRWERLLPRVFGVGVDHLDPTVRIRSAWLWAGEGAVIGYEGAAWWLGIRQDPPLLLQVIVPPARRMSPQPNLRVVRAIVSPTEQLSRNQVMVTAPERTCLDLIRQQRADLLVTALRLRRTTPAQLEDSVTAGRGRRGQLRARAAVSEVAANPWSEPERILHRLLTAAGMTGWRANVPIRTSQGIRYPDVLFERIRLLVEVDGHEHHGSREAFEADHLRQNHLIEAGWTVLRFPARRVQHHPEQVIASIRRTVNQLSTGRRLGEATDL